MKCCSETLKSLPGSKQKKKPPCILSGADSLSTLLPFSSLFTTNRICIRAAQPLEPQSSRSLSLSHCGDVTFGHASTRSGVTGSQRDFGHTPHTCVPLLASGERAQASWGVAQFRHVQETVAGRRCFQSRSRLF